MDKRTDSLLKKSVGFHICQSQICYGFHGRGKEPGMLDGKAEEPRRISKDVSKIFSVGKLG